MNVVITGSTQGIGLGMSREFLQRGHNVMISSRRPEAVDEVVADLRVDFPDCEIAGRVCDVAEYTQIQNLWDRALEAFGSVDIWVNNAVLKTERHFFTCKTEKVLHEQSIPI